LNLEGVRCQEGRGISRVGVAEVRLIGACEALSSLFVIFEAIPMLKKTRSWCLCESAIAATHGSSLSVEFAFEEAVNSWRRGADPRQIGIQDVFLIKGRTRRAGGVPEGCD
jgi:hypothetical protein